eukprot:jgi/Tetstr1/462065/TSEL_007135.t1
MSMQAQCEQLRATLARLLEQGDISDEAELASACQSGKLLLMEMKEANRETCEEMEGLREQTASSKSELDSLNLVLQNLLYEKSYYQKEIAACEDFKSKYGDEDVALLPLEQYAQLTGAMDAADDHETMLARLTHETERRKGLHAQLETLRSEQAAAEEEGRRQDGFLKGLVEQLKGISAAADTVKAQLRAPRGAMAFLSNHSELLPLPMYVLYSQLAACVDAHGLAAEVHISGSLDDAEAAADESARAHSRADPAAEQRVKLVEADGDADMMDTDRRHGTTDLEASLDAQLAKKDLYTRHPLDVILTLFKSKTDRSPLMAVSFHYLSVLNIVTVEAEDVADNVYLANLFPGDTGAQSPNEANNQLQGGKFQFDLTLKDRPYRWAQHLAGMDFLPAVAVQPTRAQAPGDEGVAAGMAAYRQQGRHLAVARQLRQRKLGSEGLKSQLAELAQLRLPSLAGQPPLPAAQCRLVAWSETSGTGGGAPMLLSAAYSRLLGAATVSASSRGASSGAAAASTPDEGELPGGGGAMRVAAAEALSARWAALGRRSFKAQLRRGDVLLAAQLDVGLEYPAQPPAVVLQQMSWPAVEGAQRSKTSSSVKLPESELKALEAEVNIMSARMLLDPALAPRAAAELLTRQVAMLMTAFDLYAEQAATQRAIRAAGAPAQPPLARGRDMRRPILVCPATGERSYATLGSAEH